MDQSALDLTRRNAGADYLLAIEDLGLRPNALFWGFDQNEDRFVLMLATEMFDFKGPLAVSQLLFKAYVAAATPAEIDPFVVRLHSPDHVLIRHFDGWKDLSKVKITSGKGNPPIDPSVRITGVAFGNIQFFPEWVYQYQLPPKRKPGDLVRKWHQLERNVNRLAA